MNSKRTPRAAGQSSDPSIDIAAIETRVEARIMARIVAALSSAPTPAVYSTRRRCGPEWLGDREWKRIAPTLTGAFRPPGSRWICVPSAAVEAYRATLGIAPAKVANDAEPTQPWTPGGALAAAGLRGSK